MELTTYSEEVFSISRLFSSNTFPLEKLQNASFKHAASFFGSWAPLSLSARTWKSKKTLGYQDFMSWWRRGLNESFTKRCV